ncbi:MAG: Yip1 family protein [Candidatus Altiarchaeota archaeon]
MTDISKIIDFLKPFAEVTVHPTKVFTNQKKKADAKQSLFVAISTYFFLCFAWYYNLFEFTLSWFALFPLIYFLIVFSVLILKYFIDVAIIYAVGKAFDGKGKFVELLWCTSILIVPTTFLTILIGWISYFSGWLRIFHILLFFYSAFLGYKLVRAVHGISGIKSIATLVSSYIGQMGYLFIVVFITYIVIIVGLLGVIFGGNYLYPSQTSVNVENGHLVYSNNQKGYQIIFPDGWEEEKGAGEIPFFEMRSFTKDNSTFLIQQTPFDRLIPETPSNFSSKEECESVEPNPVLTGIISIGSYKDYGAVIGCETSIIQTNQGTVSTTFSGTVCGNFAQFTYTPEKGNTNQSIEDYDQLMQSFKCFEDQPEK